MSCEMYLAWQIPSIKHCADEVLLPSQCSPRCQKCARQGVKTNYPVWRDIFHCHGSKMQDWDCEHFLEWRSSE